MKAKKAPTCQINDAVSAELYLDGLNLVLSPSVHKSGHTYSWEVTGDIPEVSWTQLCRWFGFSAPEAKKRSAVEGKTLVVEAGSRISARSISPG
jgi:hypothetical protein